MSEPIEIIQESITMTNVFSFCKHHSGPGVCGICFSMVKFNCDEQAATEIDRLSGLASDLAAALEAYREAIDIMADGPDESDVAHAGGILSDAAPKARAALSRYHQAFPKEKGDDKA